MSAPPTLLPLHIAPDHPAFAGHFPGHPIVPGVVLLDEALQRLSAAEGVAPASLQVGVAKFLVPVRPGEPLHLSYRASAPGRYAGEVCLGDMAERAGAVPRVAASFTLTLQDETHEGGA